MNSELELSGPEKVTINHLLRNIDLSTSDRHDSLFDNTREPNSTISLLALAVRKEGESIHHFFMEEHELLQVLPLSLSSWIIATAKKTKLISSFSVDEEEDLFITLNIKNCKKFLNAIKDHITENEKYFHSLLNEELARESSFVIFS